MYLEYTEYVAYGGTITEQGLYNRLEFRAESLLDRITLGRIKNMTTISEAIKRCMFELIGVVERSSDSEMQMAMGVSSVSNDGVSVTYGNGAASGSISDSVAMHICRDYLIGEVDANGVPLIYHGLC